MISLQRSNSLSVTLSGFSEGEMRVMSATDTLAINLVPFLRGRDATWETLTQAEYDALSVKNPETLYLIVE